MSVTEFGVMKTVDLKPNGSNIPVTNENRKGIFYWLNQDIYFLTFLNGMCLLYSKSTDLTFKTYWYLCILPIHIINVHSVLMTFSFNFVLYCTEYVQLYVDWILNKSIYHQFQAFYHGFHSVCASNALIVSPCTDVQS